MGKITINEIDLEIDLLDADEVDRYERAMTEIVDKIQEPTQYDGLSNSDGMRIQCRYVDELFDKLFGPGTAARVFGGGSNLGVRLDAYGKVSRMADEAGRDVDALMEKYSPSRTERSNVKKRRKPKYHNHGYRGR